MELAPLGSLRSELDKRTRNIFNELSHPDTVLSQMIFSKDLTYKMVFQVRDSRSCFFFNVFRFYKQHDMGEKR